MTFSESRLQNIAPDPVLHFQPNGLNGVEIRGKGRSRKAGNLPFHKFLDCSFRCMARRVILHENVAWNSRKSKLFIDNWNNVFAIAFSRNNSPVLFPKDSRSFSSYARKAALKHPSLFLWNAINNTRFIELFANASSDVYTAKRSFIHPRLIAEKNALPLFFRPQPSYFTKVFPSFSHFFI
jgi:hypothetical protein